MYNINMYMPILILLAYKTNNFLFYETRVTCTGTKFIFAHMVNG